jgi:hypothetical protein
VEGDKEEIERLAKVGVGCFNSHGPGYGPVLQNSQLCCALWLNTLW